MLFKVSKQYARGNPIPTAQFADIADAKLFIENKLLEDARFKVTATYRLYEGVELMQEFTQADAASSATSQSGTQQRGSGQTFSPTPFNTAPRPSGMPQNWVKDSDKKKEDDQR